MKKPLSLIVCLVLLSAVDTNAQKKPVHKATATPFQGVKEFVHLQSQLNLKYHYNSNFGLFCGRFSKIKFTLCKIVYKWSRKPNRI